MGAMRYQPQGCTRLNQSPLRRGLASYLPLTGAKTADLVDNVAWGIGGGSPRFDGAPRGSGLRVNGVSAPYFVRSAPVILVGAGQPAYSFRFRLYFHSLGAKHGVMSWASVANDGAPRFYLAQENAALALYYAGSYHATFPLAVEREYVVTVTFDGVVVYVYVNGVLFQSGTMGGGNNANFYIGNGYDPVKSDTDFLVSDFALWNRALSANEVKSDADNPWQLFDAPEEEDFVTASSAPVGNAYSLPAAQGSYAITGNPAGLRASRRLTASAGAYSIIGNAVRLLAGHRMTAAAGTYVLTGQPANLTRGTVPKSLQVSSGAYSITGQPAVLRVARRLATVPGSYAIIGFGTAVPTVTSVAGFSRSTIMRNNPINASSRMSAAAINRTANLI